MFGDVAISVTDINFDEDETAAYYGGQTTLAQILNDRVESPKAVSALKQALPGGMQSGISTGGPGGGVNEANESGAGVVQPSY